MNKGRTYLIGAGPGGSDLLTIRALRLLRLADVIIQDDLLPFDFLEQAGIPLDGKQIHHLGGSGFRESQDDINEMILKAALRGLIVARLKTGDPFVFGRAGEEIEFLLSHGIPVEVVPGVSSATAAPAGVWLELTRRGENRSFAVVSARCVGGGINDVWPKADNLVVLMGVTVIEEIVKRMLNDGWPHETPAAVIERASMPWERRAYSTIGGIAEVTRKSDISAPAVLVFGPAAVHDKNKQERPLILFTGLDPAYFRILGDLVHWPALAVQRDESVCRNLLCALNGLDSGVYDCLIFTSRSGVDSFFQFLAVSSLDSRALAGKCIVAAGNGTALLLGEHGIHADAIPAGNDSDGLLKAVGTARSVLLIQGSHAPRDLQLKLQKGGVKVKRVAVYKIKPHPEIGRPLPDYDAIYFVSPSGVRAYWDVYGENAFKKEIWCMGEMVRGEIARLGFKGKVVNPNDND